MNAMVPDIVVGLDESALPPSGYVLIWRAPSDLRLTPAARELLDRDPKIPCPSHPLPRTAIKRAAHKLTSGKPGLFVRPSHTTPNGCLIVRQVVETREGDDDAQEDFQVLLRCELGLLGVLDITVVPTDVDEDIGDAAELAEEMRRLFLTCLDTIAAPDVTSWLTRYVLPLCQAASLRTSAGGAYFVPARGDNKSVLDRVTQALHLSSADMVMVLPAFSSDPALCAAVLDSLAGEVEAFVATVDPDELGERALANRKSKCIELRTRVAEFAKLLHRSAPDLLAQLDSLDFELVVGELRDDSAPLPI